MADNALSTCMDIRDVTPERSRWMASEIVELICDTFQNVVHICICDSLHVYAHIVD
jgi:hypothetical protein